MSQPVFIGIDLGTSGVRAVCVDQQLQTQARTELIFTPDDDRRDPALWWSSVRRVIHELLETVPARTVAAMAVDGTSGTMIGVDRSGDPVTRAQLYNDTCDDQALLQSIGSSAPPTAAVHGASSGLARALALSHQASVFAIAHEADWIAGRLSGRQRLSDENNALKTGYDPVARRWPDWIAALGLSPDRLPEVVPAGAVIGPVWPGAAQATGLNESTLVVAGTTDGCASFLATGATVPGDGVSVLGSTLTIKLLSDRPIFSPELGIYSHRLGDRWLAGGASNSGGQVLAHFFSSDRLQRLSEQIDCRVPSTLDYYPLIRPGERFPINDSDLQPRLSPRPDSDTEFLHGLLQGIASIEYLAYQQLHGLGAPPLCSIRTVGGGARNDTWTTIRQQQLAVPFVESISNQAAVGTASLARDGYQRQIAQ